MKTEIIDNLANEAIYQVKNNEYLYFTHKKIKKILLIVVCIKFNNLIVLHQYKFLNV